jgi:hypothetical protein
MPAVNPAEQPVEQQGIEQPGDHHPEAGDNAQTVQ